MKHSKITKFIIKLFALLFIFFLVLEVSGRIYAMIKLGVDYGAFGTKLNTSKLDNSQHLSAVENYSTYSKYKPHSKKRDTDANNRIFEFTINNIGFRGSDVNAEKEDSVFRVVCLGGSSTFGYGNRDNQTYPYYLDSLLNKALLQAKDRNIKKFEVVNLGMPFQTSDRILGLF